MLEIDYLTKSIIEINRQIFNCNEKLSKSMQIINDEKQCLIKYEVDKIQLASLLRDVNGYLKQNVLLNRKKKSKTEYLHKTKEKLAKDKCEIENRFIERNKNIINKIRQLKIIIKKLKSELEEKEEIIMSQEEELKEFDDIEINTDYYENAAIIIQTAWRNYKEKLSMEEYPRKEYFSNIKQYQKAPKGILKQFLNIKTWKKYRKY